MFLLIVKFRVFAVYSKTGFIGEIPIESTTWKMIHVVWLYCPQSSLSAVSEVTADSWLDQ